MNGRSGAPAAQPGAGLPAAVCGTPAFDLSQLTERAEFDQLGRLVGFLLRAAGRLIFHLSPPAATTVGGSGMVDIACREPLPFIKSRSQSSNPSMSMRIQVV